LQRSFIILAWVFVVAVALFDCGFAWCYRDTFSQWETNPLMMSFDPLVAIAFRAGSVVFALGVIPFTTRGFRMVATCIILAASLYLAGVYLWGLLS
jgi:hypothetical protein